MQIVGAYGDTYIIPNILIRDSYKVVLNRIIDSSRLDINGSQVELIDFTAVNDLTSITAAGTLTMNGNVSLQSILLETGTLEIVGLNNSIASWSTAARCIGKIIIARYATFTTPLPAIPAYYEVVDLRTTIPLGDTNRT
jgi:hypothetical protein